MDDEHDNGGIITAVLGCGLLSPILDRVDVRGPLTLTDWQFDRMVRGLFDEGRIAIDVLECRYIH
jgi:hypothetical protein